VSSLNIDHNAENSEEFHGRDEEGIGHITILNNSVSTVNPRSKGNLHLH
jgi:hypothetical protein